jgi:hypothetical protein
MPFLKDNFKKTCLFTDDQIESIITLYQCTRILQKQMFHKELYIKLCNTVQGHVVNFDIILRKKRTDSSSGTI